MTYLLATRAIGTLISCLLSKLLLKSLNLKKKDNSYSLSKPSLADYHKKYLSFEKILAISQLVMGIT